MNFAYYTSNKELSKQLNYGINNIQAGDRPLGTQYYFNLNSLILLHLNSQFL